MGVVGEGGRGERGERRGGNIDFCQARGSSRYADLQTATCKPQTAKCKMQMQRW